MVLQSSKQKRLNDIEVLVTLRLEQVQAFSNAGAAVPQDLANVLVFSRSELARLSRRIEVGHFLKPRQKPGQIEKHNVVGHLPCMATVQGSDMPAGP